MEKTLLVIYPPRDSERENCLFSILVAETGEALANHLCSNASYAFSDLYSGRPERIKKWTKRFGELDVKFLNQTDITKEELLKRNKEWYDNLPKKEKEKIDG